MLKNKSILITGGGSGIGEALVANLSNNNNIVICGRNEDKLKKVVAAKKMCLTMWRTFLSRMILITCLSELPMTKLC